MPTPRPGELDPRRVECVDERAQGLVLEAEISCKTTGYPAEAIVERTLLTIARAAREAPQS